MSSRCKNPVDHSPWPNDPGACCCNCKSQRKIRNLENEFAGYVCTVFVEMEKPGEERAPVFLKSCDHGYCEVFVERD